MKRYVVYSEKLKQYFCPSNKKSSHYKGDSFRTRVEDALWLKKAQYAEDYATDFNKQYGPMQVIEIDVSVSIGAIIEVSPSIKSKCDAYRPLVIEIDELTAAQTELLSNKEWKDHLKRRTYLKNFDPDYE